MLQSDPLDLGWVDDPGPYHVYVLIRLGVEPLREVFGAPDLLHDDGPLEAGILHDLSEWLLESSPHDVDAGCLIAGEREVVESRRGSEQGDPAARHDALFHRGPGRVERILHAGLLLLHGRLCGRSRRAPG